jgi:hypothetical protein
MRHVLNIYWWWYLMVKVITDKRECHCSAFNYCIDENCDRWAEIVRKNGHVDEEDAGAGSEGGQPGVPELEHRY